MKQKSFKESSLYQMGHRGELAIKRILQNRGYYIIPSYDYSGNDDKAPKMHGLNGDYVIPDLDACKRGNRLWVEVKVKSSASYTYKTKQLEHGLPLRHYNHYLKVQEETGSLVWLYILEEDTKIVLSGMINNLSPRFYRGSKMSYGGMVFFPRNEFTVLGYWIGNSLLSQDSINDLLLFANNNKSLPLPIIKSNYIEKFSLNFSMSDIYFLMRKANNE